MNPITKAASKSWQNFFGLISPYIAAIQKENNARKRKHFAQMMR